MTPGPDNVTYAEVLEANRALSRQVAASYAGSEPHFRPENVANVEAKLSKIVEDTGARRLLDLGCGTGFMINIAKGHVAEIHGVDASQEMIDQVDTSGAEITLEVGDTGALEVEAESFDVVTAYTFLHHLYDVGPTVRVAARALRPGGQFYVDLEPNKEFWDAIGDLDRQQSYDPIVGREIAMVADHEGVALEAGAASETFDLAEWGKSAGGGFTEAGLRTELEQAGFSSVRFFFEWFVGQGLLINDPEMPREAALSEADAVHRLLTRALPLSRPLFKYIGFVATR